MPRPWNVVPAIIMGMAWCGGSAHILGSVLPFTFSVWDARRLWGATTEQGPSSHVLRIEM